jgi:hypothetical protein
MDEAIACEAKGPDAKAAAKRGRPKKTIEIKIEQKSVTWTETMVETLLKSRLVTHKDLFLNCKEKNAISKACLKVVLDVNVAGAVTVDILSAKNKLNYLKKSFRSYEASLEVTGNPDQNDDIVILNPKPKYWEIMYKFDKL